MTEAPRVRTGVRSAPDAWVQNANGGRAGRATRGTTLVPSRISSSALDSLVLRLTLNDLSILQLALRLRLVSSAQIGRYVAVGEDLSPGRIRSLQRRLQQLTDWRVLDRLPRAIGGAAGGGGAWLYVVGPVGRRILMRDGIAARRTRTPGARFVDHTLAIAECCIQLHEADAEGSLELLDWHAEPDCWVAYAGPFGSRKVLRPDFYVSVGVGEQHYDRWWLEIDRDTESLPRIRVKCLLFLEYMRSVSPKDGAHPRVLWVVPTDLRADRIREVVASLPESDRHHFAVAVFEDAVSFIASEAKQ